MRIIKIWVLSSLALGLFWGLFGYKDDSTCGHPELRKDGPVTW